MANDNPLMNELVRFSQSITNGSGDFATAMQKLGYTSVFDIVRQPRPAFVLQVAQLSDADAPLAYDNAMAYAALISRLYREHKTSSGTFQQLAQRSGVRALAQGGATWNGEFKENWDEFCKVGAMAAIDSPPAYLSALHVFVKQLEDTSTDPRRILLNKRRTDLKDLLINEKSTFTEMPMLDIVNEVLGKNLRTYLDTVPDDELKPTLQVLAERRYPFTLPYNFFHHQCLLGLGDKKKPKLGELNYRASLLLPIKQTPDNGFGEMNQPVEHAQRLLSGLSAEQQTLLLAPPVFSNFYLTLNDLNNGWRTAGTTHFSPHKPLGTAYLLLSDNGSVKSVAPLAEAPSNAAGAKNVAAITFSNGTKEQDVNLDFASKTLTAASTWLVNHLHNAQANTLVASLKAEPAITEPDAQGYTAKFDLLTATGPLSTPVQLSRQRFTLTLDEEYILSDPEQDFFRKSYGAQVSSNSPLWQLTDLTDFMARTGLHAEQVEMLLCRGAHTVRLSPNCLSTNAQHLGVAIPGITGKVLPFPHPNHYGACYVNGTGTGADLYDSQLEPTEESIIRDQFDNAMGLEQQEPGDSKRWRITKTSFDRLDRLQRMIRLQNWTGIPFARLDTLIMSTIRAEGEANLGMEISKNTLRALGVFRYLNQHHSIEPEEFAALMHDLPPYASGKDEIPLFDQVFNRRQLFDTPLILDQTKIELESANATVQRATQKTLMQLCFGLDLDPTDHSLLLILEQTTRYLGNDAVKRDLPTVSSLYRQARIARLFDYSVEDLLTLAGLLGGRNYKTILASGRLSLQTDHPAADILDVLMQLNWAVAWLAESQQSTKQLQQRLGPNVPVVAEEGQHNARTRVTPSDPVPDDVLERLNRLLDDTYHNLVTEQQTDALGLPRFDDATPNPQPIPWFKLLENPDLLSKGLLTGRPLSLVDAPLSWLQAGVDKLVKDQKLTADVKEICNKKLVEFLFNAYNRQTQLLEVLFQEIAKLPPDRCVAVLHWAHSSVYSFLSEALTEEVTPALIENFQRVSRHAELAVQLRLSNGALRLFLVNPTWLRGALYAEGDSEPTLSDLYLFERFSHWLNSQSESEDSLLSYFSLANPPKARLKNKALRQATSEAANGTLARLLKWSEAEVSTLTDTLTDKRARSMAEVDWVRRCQASCDASGLSAKALLQATDLNDQSKLDDWKTVGEAVMAASTGAPSTPDNG